MRYLPHTQEEIAEMLQAAGLSKVDDLFSSIPQAIRDKAKLELEPALDESTLMRHVDELAAKNEASTMLSFLGAGAYDHVFPQAADQLLMRSEFYTAYTPYQPEVAQGTLQVIFEFQTIVSEILDLPVANASMYDASTALAEAVLMARRLTKRDRVLLSGGVHPQYEGTVRTYLAELDGGEPKMDRIEVTGELTTDLAGLEAALSDDVSCVVVSYPNFYGTAADLTALAEKVHAVGAKLITVTQEPFALAVMKPPGAMGADIAVAEGQALGLPPQYGGPGVGLFACHADRKVLQQMPGRLCGETVDKDGKRGYVLTLSTREQHIRRERATSNICTNSGLCATALTIKMCMLGKRGFIEIGEQCLSKAAYLADAVGALEGYAVATSAPLFNELPLTVRGGNAKAVSDKLAAEGLLAGVPSRRPGSAEDDILLVAVTERHSKADLDRLVAALDGV